MRLGVGEPFCTAAERAVAPAPAPQVLRDRPGGSRRSSEPCVSMPMVTTARERGIQDRTLHTWSGTSHWAERQTPHVHDEHVYDEGKRLRRDNIRWKVAQAIVKKAAASFAPPRP